MTTPRTTTSNRRTHTDRSGAILSLISRRKRVQRRRRSAAQIMMRLRDLPAEDAGMIYGMGLALIDLRLGRMGTDDATQFRALKAADTGDVDALEAWLSAHNYIRAE